MLNDKVRRFTNPEGFGDSTDYLEYNPATDQVFLVLNDGSKQFAKHWFLEDCTRNVESGDWVELPVENEEIIRDKPRREDRYL